MLTRTISPATAGGGEEAVAESEMGGQGNLAMIGIGGGASGMWGYRDGGGRKRAVGKYGGSRGSESAVNAGLRWLKKHQSPGGGWDTANYFQNCEEKPKCEPGKGGGESDPDVAMTGYALLCFLGAGFDHKSPSQFQKTVEKGLKYLVERQAPDGLIGKRNYEHPIATMALVEAFAVTMDDTLKGPAQRGVDMILARQNSDPKATDSAYSKFGWDYVQPKERNDSSVSGWNVMCLKSAFGAGLNVGSGISGAKNWLEKVWKATNPGWEKFDKYKDQSRFPYTYNAQSGEIGIGTPGSDSHDLACVGMVACVFLGHHEGDIMLETLANYVLDKQMPRVL